MIVGVTVLMTLVANLSRFSPLAAIAMHLVFNLSSGVVNRLADAEIKRTLSPETVFAFSSLSVAGLVVLATRGRLGETPGMREHGSSGDQNLARFGDVQLPVPELQPELPAPRLASVPPEAETDQKTSRCTRSSDD
jgi:hypothetical protein